MLVVRNAILQDLEAVFALAERAGDGMTTLKPDRDALRRRLEIVEASFACAARRDDADYLFVLEDTASGRVCGVSAIKAAVGVDAPFYNYRLGMLMHANAPSGVVNRAQVLYPSHDLSGASELCSLYLHPDDRQGVNGKLLSKARLLFIAQFPHLFADTVFAEMRGYLTPDGVSPFWESLGRHFFKMDFQQADDLCGAGDRQFIEQLMPRLPVYADLLGQEARAAIGQSHVETVPARRMLEKEGLHFGGYIDIFDGGPVLQSTVQALNAVKHSALKMVARPDTAAAPDAVASVFVATTTARAFRVIAAPARAFRVIAAPARAGADTVALDQASMAALGCGAQAVVRVYEIA